MWCVCVRVYIRVSSCVRLHVAAIQTRSCDPNSVTGDSNLFPLWTRYTGNSKTDPWDDSEIRTGSCNEDQTVIWFQNRVISCECSYVFLYLLLPVGVHVTIRIISVTI